MENLFVYFKRKRMAEMKERKLRKLRTEKLFPLKSGSIGSKNVQIDYGCLTLDNFWSDDA